MSVLILALASGCTFNMPIAVVPTTLPDGQVFPHHAALMLSQEYTNYTYKFEAMGTTIVHPLGPALANYATNVVSKTFQQVEMVPNGAAAEALTSADLILIPRAVKCDLSVPPWAWDNEIMTLVVEWTVKNRTSQNTICLKTITANAQEKAGNGHTMKKHDLKLKQKLFDDLSLKTYKAFQEAPELRGSQH